MLSKGQGNSLGTYRLMIEAYHRLGRVNEMEELWTNTLQTQLESMPRGMFSHIMRIYIERENFYKVLEVFFSEFPHFVFGLTLPFFYCKIVF